MKMLEAIRKTTVLHKWIPYLKYIWALPITLIGLLIVLLILPSRPRWAWLSIGGTHALCVWGGWLDIALQKHPLGSMYAAAIGHVVVARDARRLCLCGAHEFEHVRQVERWGVFLPAAYVLDGLWQIYQGKQFYRNNRFEEAAYRFGPEPFKRQSPPMRHTKKY